MLVWVFSVLAVSAEKLLLYLTVVLVGSVKFLVAVLMALAANFSMGETLLTATLGAAIGVWALAYFGTQIRNWIDTKWKRNKKPTNYSFRKMMVTVWKKFGMVGVAFLAPILSPPISVGVAISFREKPRRIFWFMLGGLLFWSLILTIFRDTAMGLLGQGD
ncbi:MAG: hypothetical protein AAF388_25425 [Bacteroidota bacterium]